MAESPAARESPSPRAFREDPSYTPPPPAYRAPSMLAEHTGLAVVFAVAALAFASYCLKTKHPAHARSAPAVPPPAAIAAQPPGLAPRLPGASLIPGTSNPPAASNPTSARSQSEMHSAPTQSVAAQPIYVESLP